jgi:hypothetical protein
MRTPPLHHGTQHGTRSGYGQSWLFVRPLDLPLTFRHENGRFGSLRPKPLPGPPPCAAGQIIPADDPRNPTDADVYARTRNVDVTLRWRASTFWGVDVVTQVELT